MTVPEIAPLQSPLAAVQRLLDRPGNQGVIIGGVAASLLGTPRLDVVMELRSIVVTSAPNVTEVTDRNGLIYYDADRGGHVSAGVCQIRTKRDHIELAFVHGAFLPDPLGLLVGDQKAMRHVDIRSFDDAPWPALQALIEASARFGPRSPNRQSVP